MDIKSRIAAKFGSTKKITKEDVEYGDVAFTYVDFLGSSFTRRERRAAERAGLTDGPLYTTIELPFDALYLGRPRRRAAAAHRATRQRKGSRAFYRQQQEAAYAKEITAGQLRVLEAGPDAPGNAARYENVFNACLAKYGQGFLDQAVQA